MNSSYFTFTTHHSLSIVTTMLFPQLFTVFITMFSVFKWLVIASVSIMFGVSLLAMSFLHPLRGLCFGALCFMTLINLMLTVTASSYSFGRMVWCLCMHFSGLCFLETMILLLGVI